MRMRHACEMTGLELTWVGAPERDVNDDKRKVAAVLNNLVNLLFAQLLANHLPVESRKVRTKQTRKTENAKMTQNPNSRGQDKEHAKTLQSQRHMQRQHRDHGSA